MDVTDKRNIPEHIRFFGCRFLYALKRADNNTRHKSRLFGQKYADEGATAKATKAPTVQKFTKRSTLCIAASHNRMTAYSRDIMQAYVQRGSNLERTIYLQPPHEMNFASNEVPKVVKPLYSIPESGLHW